MNLLQNWIVTGHMKVAVEGPFLISIIMDPEHKTFDHFFICWNQAIEF